MSTTVRQSPPPSGYSTPDIDSDELAGRLAEHLVAVALVRKAPDDPVPFSVWWRVTDALRASTEQPPRVAADAVDVALAVLQGAIDGILLTPTDRVGLVPTDPSDARRALRHAQVLVARLVLGAAATSPTLLHVRLVRLRRALLAAAALRTTEPAV